MTRPLHLLAALAATAWVFATPPGWGRLPGLALLAWLGLRSPRGLIAACIGGGLAALITGLTHTWADAPHAALAFGATLGALADLLGPQPDTTPRADRDDRQHRATLTTPPHHTATPSHTPRPAQRSRHLRTTAGALLTSALDDAAPDLTRADLTRTAQGVADFTARRAAHSAIDVAVVPAPEPVFARIPPDLLTQTLLALTLASFRALSAQPAPRSLTLTAAPPTPEAPDTCTLTLALNPSPPPGQSLGLDIARRIAQAHHGTLHTTTPNTIALHLPCATPPGDATPPVSL